MNWEGSGKEGGKRPKENELGGVVGVALGRKYVALKSIWKDNELQLQMIM